MNGARGSGGAPDQLALGVTLTSRRRFANFVPGPNAAAVAALQDLLARGAGGAVYLWGGAGSGKTHLLEACCAHPAVRDRPAAYVALGDGGAAPGMLDGLAEAGIVCIDDAHAVAGDPAWEEALFHLYNRADQAGRLMVFAARAAPRATPWRLADLVSRFTAAVIWRLHPLADRERREALRRHARDRGFELGDEVTDYLMRRLPRDMESLTGFLERLDRSSLAAQRRVTVPFVRDLLEATGGSS